MRQCDPYWELKAPAPAAERKHKCCNETLCNNKRLIHMWMSFIFQIHTKSKSLKYSNSVTILMLVELLFLYLFFKILLGHLVSKVALNILHYNLELQ